MTITPISRSLDQSLHHLQNKLSKECQVVNSLVLERLQLERSPLPTRPCTPSEKSPFAMCSTPVSTPRANMECPQTKSTSTVDDDGFISSLVGVPPLLKYKSDSPLQPGTLPPPPKLPFSISFESKGVPSPSVKQGKLVVASVEDVVVQVNSFSGGSPIDLLSETEGYVTEKK